VAVPTACVSLEGVEHIIDRLEGRRRYQDGEFDEPRFAASLMNRSVGDVIRILVERLCQQQEPGEEQDEPSFSGAGAETGADAKSGTPDWLAVYRIYKKQRFDAEFNPSTMEARITSVPAPGAQARPLWLVVEGGLAALMTASSGIGEA